MKLLLVRHGKDEEGVRGGWSSFDLTDEGRNQALKLAEYLLKNKDLFCVKHIVSSDLPRAMSTAKFIAEKLEIPIIKETTLREMNNGDLAGMPNNLAEAKYPGLYFNTLGMNERYPNGESPLDFYNRIQNWFVDFLSQKHEMNDNILVVTHSGVINILYHIVKNIEWNNQNKSFKVENCSLHVLDIQTMHFEKENYVDFLLNK